MPSQTVMSENGAAQCSPSDCGERSLIRECDSHRPWETDLFRARDFEFSGERVRLAAVWTSTCPSTAAGIVSPGSSIA